MENNIKLLLSVYLFAKYIPKPKILRRKPFTCPMCMAFWCFVVLKCVDYTGMFDLITIPLCFAFIAVILEQANDKYLLR